MSLSDSETLKEILYDDTKGCLLLLVNLPQSFQHGIVFSIECFELRVLSIGGRGQDSICKADAVGLAVIALVKASGLSDLGTYRYNPKKGNIVLQSNLFSIANSRLPKITRLLEMPFFSLEPPSLIKLEQSRKKRCTCIPRSLFITASNFFYKI